VFTPTPDEIAHWEEVIDLMAARQAEGVGAFTLNGKMIDEADAKTAKENLAVARQLLGGRSRRQTGVASADVTDAKEVP
jgi:citrate lyase beta subunit